jgi:tetratricopeptide (TPR) repeat protein
MRYLFSFFLVTISSLSLFSQTLNQAKTFYLKEAYVSALPIFKTYLQKKPKDASLNLWYGVCLSETGQPKAALSYLEYAESKNITQANWFQARASMHLGDLETAVDYLDKYLTINTLSSDWRNKAIQLKDSLKTRISQPQRVEDITIIDSVVVPIKELYSTLQLAPESGVLVASKVIFPRMNDQYGYAFIPQRNDRAYYADSLFGHGLDLVARHRIPTGWDTPELLPSPINTASNEINPYFLQDGITLYFASDTSSGMGGYDLYVTRYNLSSKTYLKPDRLNRPFNSPANDYFLVIDERAQKGYFATDRNAPKGFVTIYTFIPQSVTTLVKETNLKKLENLANINAIKDTWIGKNMDSLLSLIPVRLPETIVDTTKTNIDTTENQQRFSFFINDSITYTTIEAFQSIEAQNLCRLFISKTAKFNTDKNLLSAKRLSYSEAEPAQKERLAADILQLEKESKQVQNELPLLEINVRNLELTTLLKNSISN